MRQRPVSRVFKTQDRANLRRPAAKGLRDSLCPKMEIHPTPQYSTVITQGPIGRSMANVRGVPRVLSGSCSRPLSSTFCACLIAQAQLKHARKVAGRSITASTLARVVSTARARGLHEMPASALNVARALSCTAGAQKQTTPVAKLINRIEMASS
ncbi:hypothetical protein Q7P37_005312 [Cladosporium fusiforme]